MKTKIKIHDGIVGAVIFASVTLGITVHPAWLYVAGVIGALMVSSAFTGFCPVYFVLNKALPRRSDAGVTSSRRSILEGRRRSVVAAKTTPPGADGAAPFVLSDRFG